MSYTHQRRRLNWPPHWHRGINLVFTCCACEARSQQDCLQGGFLCCGDLFPAGIAELFHEVALFLVGVLVVIILVTPDGLQCLCTLFIIEFLFGGDLPSTVGGNPGRPS